MHDCVPARFITPGEIVSRTRYPVAPRSARLLLVLVWAGCSLLGGNYAWSQGYRMLTESSAPTIANEAIGGEEAEPRRPIGLTLSDDERLLFVANQCGTLSVLDAETGRLLAEYPLGSRLSGLTWFDKQHLLVLDEHEHDVIQLSVRETEVEVLARIPVSPYPVAVVVDREAGVGYVTSLWSHRVTELKVGDRGILEVGRTLDLPFAPRCILAAPDGRHLVIADSFAGRLVVVDREAFQVGPMRVFPSHNIRGLASSVNGEKFVVAHQMLNDLAHSVRNDVHWGLLMSNDLRWLRFEAVLRDESDLYQGSHMHPLGEAGNAAADPSTVVVARNGTVIVGLGGVDEIAIGRETDFSFYRIPVGKRPVAIAVLSDSQQAFVANMFDDTISRVHLPRREVIHHISLGASRPLTLIERGERFFFSGRLSHDGWMSCHSCHTDGHTNGGLNDNFSDRSFGASKRVLSLLGVAGTAPFAWNGEVDDLETQIHNSVNHTMQSDKQMSEKNMAGMVAFLESLVPPPSVDRLRGTLDELAVVRGQAIFEQRGCVQCHAPPLYTTPDRYDVGLEDSEGNRHFNPPSLRGVGQRGPYFHDNSAKDLESVFREHGHPLGEERLPEVDLQDLLAFLRSL